MVIEWSSSGHRVVIEWSKDYTAVDLAGSSRVGVPDAGSLHLHPPPSSRKPLTPLDLQTIFIYFRIFWAVRKSNGINNLQRLPI